MSLAAQRRKELQRDIELFKAFGGAVTEVPIAATGLEDGRPPHVQRNVAQKIAYHNRMMKKDVHKTS